MIEKINRILIKSRESIQITKNNWRTALFIASGYPIHNQFQTFQLELRFKTLKLRHKLCKLIDLMNKLIEIEPIKAEKVGIDLFHFILFGEKKSLVKKKVCTQNVSFMLISELIPLYSCYWCRFSNWRPNSDVKVGPAHVLSGFILALNCKSFYL